MSDTPNNPQPIDPPDNTGGGKKAGAIDPPENTEETADEEAIDPPENTGGG
jgi:hypothetical protein